MSLLPASFYASECRRRLAAARSHLCPHGVRPMSCTDHAADAPTTQPAKETT